jgi:chromosomal replication initiator protein
MSALTIHFKSVEIIEAVGRRMKVPVAVLLSPTRGSAQTANARHLAAWLMRYGLSMSYPEISQALGRKDHGTAMHSVKLVDAWREQDAAIHLITSKLLDGVSRD